MNPHSIVCLNVKELLVQGGRHIWRLIETKEIRTHNHLVRKWPRNHLAKLAKWLSCDVNTYFYGSFWLYVLIMSRTSFRVNPHSIVCLNVKELLGWSRDDIWDLSDSKEIRSHNHLVYKWTLKDLAQLAK